MKRFLLVACLFVSSACVSTGGAGLSASRWLVIGQSNSYLSSNFTADVTLAEGYVHGNGVFDDEAFTTISGDFPGVAGSFARWGAALTGKRVQVIAAGLNGSRIDCWLGNCFTEQALPYADAGVQGVIWWQGESNANAEDGSYNTYYDDLSNFMMQVKDTFGDVPVVIVQLQNYYPCVDKPEASCDEPAGWEVVREAQAQVAEDIGAYLIKTQDITYGELHPTYAYDEIGARIATAVY